MTNMDKLKIKQLVDESDYDLWVIRVKAILRAQGLSEFVDASPASEMSAAGTNSDSQRREKASAIIVTSLGDKALRVVCNVTSDPALMLSKLDERYNSKTIAAKISKMAELVSLHYEDRSKDIAVHIDRLAGLIDHLHGMSLPMDDTMAIGILIASIKVQKLAPVVAAIKTIPDKDMKWDTVAARLIEDWKDLPKVKEEAVQTSYSAQDKCEFCGRPGHSEGDCQFKKKFIRKWTDKSLNDDSDSKTRRKKPEKREA